MPNDQISKVGQAIARDSAAPVEPRPAPSVPAEASSVPAATSPEHSKSPATIADPAEVKQATEQINAFIKKLNASNVQFSVDKASGRVVVKVVDHETGDVIRQIPSEEALAIASSLDTPKGVIIRSKA